MATPALTWSRVERRKAENPWKANLMLHRTFIISLLTLLSMTVTSLADNWTIGSWNIENLGPNPLVVWIDVLGDDGEPVDDLLLIGLHLKSVQNFRDNHLVAIVKLITELEQFYKTNGIPESEEDVIILGDLNDSAHRRVRFKYMFDYMADNDYTHLRNDNGDYPDTRINGSEIDHIFVADHLVFDWIDPGSFTVHVEGQHKNDDIRKAYRRDFSDHFPLTFEFEFAEDE